MSGRTLRLLAVQNSDADMAMVRDRLQAAGYAVEVSRVTTAAQMCEALERQRFDLVVSDYDLQQFDALAALRVAQASGLDLPFLIVSSRIGEERAIELMQAGAHDYVTTEQPGRLLTAVDRALSEAHKRRERRRAEEALRASDERDVHLDQARLRDNHRLLPRRGPDALSSLPRGTETVLLVEDETAVRDLIRDFLVRCGYTVVDAADPSHAFDRFDEHRGRLQLLITDVVMPQMNGRELAEALLARQPDLRVLFMSGYTDDQVLAHGVARGAGFLQKPFTPDVLARKVREVLDADGRAVR